MDVVRFLAFVAVFLHHLAPAVPGDSNAVVAFKNALGFGLCLFFTLSAYLITMLLLREKDVTETVSLTKFYKRRILRIWPLYFAAIGFGALLTFLEGRLHSQWLWFALALVMAGNFILGPETVMAHLWSISVEEQFYVLWPSLAKYLGRKSLVLAAVVMLVVSNTALAYFGATHAETDPRVWCNSLVQFEMFAVGILLALFDASLKPAMWARIVCLAIVLPVWFAANSLFHIKVYQLPAQSAFSLCAGYGMVAVSCGMLIFALNGLHRWPKWMVYLGKISYGLYVFHGPAIRTVHRLNFAPRLVLALGLTVVLASLSYRYFETPFLRMKEKLEVIRSRPVESA